MTARPELAIAPARDRLDWPHIVEQAAIIVRSYTTGVTLRQLFYRLVVAALIPNLSGAYKRLSATTAAARREGRFPDLIDQTRTIHCYQTFQGVADARAWLADVYRRDRTEGQDVSLYLGVEKHGIVAQLEEWFGDLGIPILALGGYSSETYVREITADQRAQQRPAILLYAGDWDPSGEDILRDFMERTGGCFDQMVRVALTSAQVEQYGLPEMPGKDRDSRAAAFTRRHGRLAQVELDALDPDTLKDLYQAGINRFWDTSRYEAVLEREAQERRSLQRQVRRL